MQPGKNHFQHEDRRASCDTCVVVLFVKHVTGRLAKTKTLFNTTADRQRVMRASVVHVVEDHSKRSR